MAGEKLLSEAACRHAKAKLKVYYLNDVPQRRKILLARARSSLMNHLNYVMQKGKRKDHFNKQPGKVPCGTIRH